MPLSSSYRFSQIQTEGVHGCSLRWFTGSFLWHTNIILVSSIVDVRYKYRHTIQWFTICKCLVIIIYWLHSLRWTLLPCSLFFLCRFIFVLSLDTLPYCLILYLQCANSPTMFKGTPTLPQRRQSFSFSYSSAHGQGLIHHCISQSLNYSSWRISQIQFPQKIRSIYIYFWRNWL